jgi:twitching motility protein PilJ
MNLVDSNPFSRLLLWQKLTLLSVTAAILVAIPFYLYYQSEQKAIDIAFLEQQGLKPSAYTLQLLEELQNYRDIAYASAPSHTSLFHDSTDSPSASSTELDKAKNAVNQKIRIIDKITGEFSYPDFLETWQAFKEDWSTQNQAIENQSLTAAQVWYEQTVLVDKLFALQDTILSGSTMDLDPDAQTYYLIQVVLVNSPAIAEKMAQARHYGSTLLTKGMADGEGISQQDRLQISGLIERTRELIKTSKNQIEHSVKNATELKSRIYDKTLLALKLAEQANKVTTSVIVNSNALSYPVEDYLAIYRQAVQQQFAFIADGIQALDQEMDHKLDANYASLYSSMAIVLSIFFIAAGIAYFISLSITNPVEYLVAVMNRLAAGDTQARANIQSHDEIGMLGREFDNMVAQREAVNAKIREENEALNNSVIELLIAVEQLSRRNLTVKVPVSEDVTGPIADALNLMTSETARVLEQVMQIAAHVSKVSRQVKSQSDTVIGIAAAEQREVEQSATELDTAAATMLDIATLALSCNEAASKAIRNTDKAQETVLGTVQGITTIRDTIRETEKRIKRLGERSQEIGSVVSIINNIAERTHILALNASMHAASAGEAGKGFAVVANEVQKLAENSREATSKIAALVNNIQVETADTVTTMNDAIGQVVRGTELAQQAGNEMRETRDATAELVQLVQSIAASSKNQSETSHRLVERAKQIQASSSETNNQLKSQAQRADLLVNLSSGLVKSVGVFTLPETTA